MDSPGPREDMDLVTVSTSSAKDVIWIVVRGEVDLSNREQLRSGLAAIDLGRASLVYLDLRLLSFCDSAGCRILLRFEKQATAAGYDVRIHRARTIVRKIMSLVRDPASG
jgi:anti-anti-sigma factor